MTGVKAHTIRIWEKRYLLIKPSRTATNRRYYNGLQLRRLMNISTLLSNGFKISHVASLSDDELSRLIDQLHSDPSKDVICSVYIHDLIAAMIGLDEPAFDKIFADAVERFGFYDSMLLVFYPFLRKTGQLWRTDKAMPVQEHFAACIVRRKIIAAIDKLPVPTNNKKKYLLFLPPGEWHETGLLFADYIIRSKGVATLYLGQNVPYADINKIAAEHKADFLFTFFITPKPADEIEKEIAALLRNNPGRELFVSGDYELLSGVKFSDQRFTYLNGVDSLLKLL